MKNIKGLNFPITSHYINSHLHPICGVSRASQVALAVKNPPANAGDARDAGSIPGLGRSPGEGNSNTLQYSCLENPVNSWQATVRSIAQSRTQLKWVSMHLLRSWMGLKLALHLSQSSGVNRLHRASFHGNSRWQEHKPLKYILSTRSFHIPLAKQILRAKPSINVEGGKVYMFMEVWGWGRILVEQ